MADDVPRVKSETAFSPAEAFERNLGLVTKDEQQKLAGCLVAIAGCGGVGGAHAYTLARLGIGRFRLTDPDTFSLANFNRQIGATMDTIGRNKAVVTAEMIRAINPQASVEIVEGGITADNATDFVRGTHAVVDGVDFFAIEARRRLFAAAWQWGAPALTAAPLGFSGTVHVFAEG
jgi:tRNA threonylcarbamoyladenosine dehydratase